MTRLLRDQIQHWWFKSVTLILNLWDYSENRVSHLKKVITFIHKKVSLTIFSLVPTPPPHLRSQIWVRTRGNPWKTEKLRNWESENLRNWEKETRALKLAKPLDKKPTLTSWVLSKPDVKRSQSSSHKDVDSFIETLKH